jgi:hypothetical protein
MRAAISLAGTIVSNATHIIRGGDFTMRTILAAMFAVMIGLTFVGSTFADDKKTDAPAGAPAGEMKKDESKKTETKSETKTENKNGKKSKKHKKTTKTEESATQEKK